MNGWVLNLVTLILFVLYVAGGCVVAFKVQHRIIKPAGYTFFCLGTFLILYPFIRQVVITCYLWIRSIP